MASPTTAPTATASVEVGASAEATYALISNIDVMASLAEETTANAWRSGSGAVGSVFTGVNENGKRSWKTQCTVTAAQAGRTFAFDVTMPAPLSAIKVSRWQYDVEPLGPDSCRVTESTWDQRPGWFRRPAQLATGVSDRTGANQAHIEGTLAKLRTRAEA